MVRLATNSITAVRWFGEKLGVELEGVAPPSLEGRHRRCEVGPRPTPGFSGVWYRPGNPTGNASLRV